MKISILIFILSSKIYVTSSSKLPSTSNLSSKLEKAENLSFEKIYGGQSSSYSIINNLDVDNVKKTAVVAHNLSPSDILIALLSDIEVGLTNQIAENRRFIFGKNMLKENEPKSIFSLILEQFQDKLVQILLAVAVLSASLAAFEKEAHAFTEPIVIFSILLINALVGILQSKSAESSLEALKKLQPTTVNVLRSGQWISDYPTTELVPGDIISVRVGDKVPADARILRLKTTTFSTDEGCLTGESATVSKVIDIAPLEATISAKNNMIFSGTMVTSGACIALVVKTGMNTEIGVINEGVQQASLHQVKTPLGEQLDKFGDQLSIVIGAICMSVWLVSIPKFSSPVFQSWYHGAMYYAKIAVALGVAAIPEGLPAVITLCLSLGTKRMAQRNVIVRNLPSVETLGCTSVICTDKTGTLTTNQMTVKTIVSFNTSSFGLEDIILKERGVEGVSYQPIGTVENLSLNDMQMKGWQDFAMICSLCNEAVVVYKDGIYERIGEPTEAALKVLVEKLGAVDIVKAYDPKMLVRQCNDHWENKFEKLAVLEFNRERKSMSTLCRSKSTQSNTLFVKGAAEVLIDRCSKIELEDGKVIDIDSNLRKKLISCVSEISRRPLRCLAIALKPSYSMGQDLTGLKTKEDSDQSAVLKDPSSFAKLESDLTLVGFCGIKDPARTEAGAAILKCREAGIRVMMITGDSKETAVSIAKDVNIFDKNEDTTQKAFTGQEFFSLPEQQQLSLLSQGNMVFCRTEPRDKQRLISLLERLKEIPAMTGDGVNDAPALKQAAIGIAMGITGTEVAKNSADMVLADDNFATIVSAVEEGRAIYGNMQSFICFLISTNIGEILSIFIATLMGLPEPLTSLHLLWVNLVTDGPPATSLGFNPPDPNAMTKPPRPKDSTIMTKWLLIRYIITGLYVGFATIGVFIWWYLDKGVSFNQLINWGDCLSWNDFNPNFKTEHYMENPCEIFTEFRSYPQTLSLSVLVVIELLKALSAVSLDTSIIKMPPWKNRWLIPGVLFPALCHLMLLYIPALSSIFSLEPLSQRDWKVVFLFSFPILFLEEILKFIGRCLSVKKTLNVVGRF